MRDSNLEYWTLSQAERVDKGLPVEDNRVELKAEWPADPYKTARRIAGHANAARGDYVLWIIGLDENNGVVGAKNEELSDWWAQVSRWFDDGITPYLHAKTVVHESGKTLVALLFATDRVPFVVKNQSGQIPHREVPWREGNAIRTAKRSDLLRLLVPIQELPDIEVLSGSVGIFYSDETGTRLDKMNVYLKLYITSMNSNIVTIPFHRCRLSISTPTDTIKMKDVLISIDPPRRRSQPGSLVTRRFDPNAYKTDSLTIESTSSEIIISGSGAANLNASFAFDNLPATLPDNLELTVYLEPVGSTRSIVLTQTLAMYEGDTGPALVSYRTL